MADDSREKAERRRKRLLERGEQRLKQIIARGECEQRLPNSDDAVDSTVRHRKTPTDESVVCDEQFPRKVSLISTPVDFKTVQQNQQNSLYSLFTLISQMSPVNSLIPVCVLTAVALFSFFSNTNFFIAFIVTQTAIIVCGCLTDKAFASNYVKIIFTVLNDLMLFVACRIICEATFKPRT